MTCILYLHLEGLNWFWKFSLFFFCDLFGIWCRIQHGGNFSALPQRLDIFFGQFPLSHLYSCFYPKTYSKLLKISRFSKIRWTFWHKLALTDFTALRWNLKIKLLSIVSYIWSNIFLKKCHLTIHKLRASSFRLLEYFLKRKKF